MWEKKRKKERKTCWQQERATENAVMVASQRWSRTLRNLGVVLLSLGGRDKGQSEPPKVPHQPKKFTFSQVVLV